MKSKVTERYYNDISKIIPLIFNTSKKLSFSIVSGIIVFIAVILLGMDFIHMVFASEKNIYLIIESTGKLLASSCIMFIIIKYALSVYKVYKTLGTLSKYYFEYLIVDGKIENIRLDTEYAKDILKEEGNENGSRYICI